MEDTLTDARRSVSPANVIIDVKSSNTGLVSQLVQSKNVNFPEQTPTVHVSVLDFKKSRRGTKLSDFNQS